MTSDDGLGVEEILEKLQETDDLPGEIHGTRLKTEEYAGGVKRTRLEIWEVLPHSVRTELLTEETVREFDFELDVAFAPTSKLGDGGDVMLRNRDGFVVYDSETNRYHRYDFEPPEDAGGYATEPTLVGSSPEANFDVTGDGYRCGARDARPHVPPFGRRR